MQPASQYLNDFFFFREENTHHTTSCKRIKNYPKKYTHTQTNTLFKYTINELGEFLNGAEIHK